MKASALRPAPRPSPWKWRGAFFCALAAAGALLWPVAQRGWAYLTLFPSVQATPKKVARRGSLDEALAKIDAKTVQAYLARWSQSEKAALLGQPRSVYIDSEALARRHPAWILAQEWESGAVSPAGPRLLRAAPSAPATSLGRFPLASGHQAQALPAAPWSASAPPVSSRPDAALGAFLRSSSARDANRARDEAFLSQRALEDEVALARRGAVAELDLPALPPDVALQLLNLRLQLLRNLSRTPAQRAATREEIRAIETRYAAILAAQTDDQAARLRAATLEVPDRLRRQGLLRIESAARQTAQTQARVRREVQAASQSLRHDDFGATPALQINLPPFTSLSPSTAAARVGAPPIGRERAGQFFETVPVFAASNPQSATPTPNSSARRAQIAARLRGQARREAAQWASLGAGALGAKWSQKKSAPDATAAVLKLLFGGGV